MAISPIGSSPMQPIQFPDLGQGAEAAGGAGFSDKLTGAIDNLQQAQSKTDDLAMQVATGQLTDIHDYMIAANEAHLLTQTTVAVKNKAVESFNAIMNMQI